MGTQGAAEVQNPPALLLTRHACERMIERRVSASALEHVLDYGREVHVRGATVYAIGRNEVARYELEGVDLAAFSGIQVVCAHDGRVLTVYRNRDFRGLRPCTEGFRRRRRRRRRL